MLRFRVLVLAAALGIGGLAPTTLHAPSAPLAPARELWFYQVVDASDSASVTRAIPIWRRAAAAGYARVVLYDFRFERPADQSPAYRSRIRRLRSLADSLRLEIVPGVSLVGRGNGAMLAADPNLAEALPVRGAKFEVHGGIARLVADPPIALAQRPDRVDGGVVVGSGAARMSAGGPRIAWTIDVSPWRSYHVSVRLAGDEFRGEARIGVTGEGRELAYANVAPPSGPVAGARDVVFNSQDHHRVTVTFGSSRSSRGTLRFSHWRIDEAGPVNLVRRPGVGFRFDGLVEGRDFDAVTDPLLGMRPWRGQFDYWHEPPVIHVRRPDGTVLRASWQHAAVLLKGQVACCLSDSAVIRRQVDEIHRVREWFGARTVFLMHDEVRAIGQDSTCLATGRTPGRILAANVRALIAANPGVTFVVWNDMFDPEHNAVADYYLARGSLAGSWEGLDRNVIVANWNARHAARSLRFFADAGHRQVWGGYYDTPPASFRDVLPALDRTPGVLGVLYATWKDRYDDLEAFAKAVRGEVR